MNAEAFTAWLNAIRSSQQDITKRSIAAAPLVLPDPKSATEQFQKLTDEAEALERDFQAWLNHDSNDPRIKYLQEIWGPEAGKMVAQALEFAISALGRSLSLIGELDRARTIFQKGVKIAEQRADAQAATFEEELGRIDFQQGHLSDAEMHFQRGLDRLKSYTDPKAWLAQEGPGVGWSDEQLAFLANKTWAAVARLSGYLANVRRAKGDRVGYLAALDDAFAVARAHKETVLARSIWRQKYEFLLGWDVTGEQLDAMDREIKSHLLDDLAQDPGFKVDAALLKARSLLAHGAPQAAESRLQEASEQAGDDLRARWSTLLAYARFYGEIPGRLEDGIQKAQAALSLVSRAGHAEMADAARGVLVRLLLDSTNPEHWNTAGEELGALISSSAEKRQPDELASALLQRAQARFLSGRLDEALKDIEGALKFALDANLRRQALTAKAAVLHALKRPSEAMQAVEQAIALYDPGQGPSINQSPRLWRDDLQHLASLHSNAAVLCAEMGRLREAFAWAERGRGLLLRQPFLSAGDAQAGAATYDTVRSALAADSAALAMFSVGQTRTMVLILSPAHDEPLVDFAEVGERDLRLLMPGGESSQQGWNDGLAKAVPALSDTLMRPLTNLRKTMATAKVVYICPDSLVYDVPVAALTFGDGAYIVESAAIAVVPSISVLLESRAKKVSHTADLRGLVLGVGRTSDGIDFADHARAIVAEFTETLGFTASTCLCGAEATKQRFLAEAAQYGILHLACHGGLRNPVMDTLSASVLELSDGFLSARDMIRPSGEWLTTQLVFLNACRSAGFRVRLGSEVGGFWQAFIVAGAKSLVATLFFVDPTYAQRIAADFYRLWQTKKLTKAEALRQVQIAMIGEGIDFRHWASHALIGDHR